MFIKKVVHKDRRRPIYFAVVETVSREGRCQSHRSIVYLGHERSVKEAYERELSAFLRSADKLERLENAASVLGWEAEYRGR